MQHGIYIAEFEKVLYRHSYAISQASLGMLVNQVNFSKLNNTPEADRIAFYGALKESIAAGISRGTENGLQVLGEQDALNIIETMSVKAAQRSFASSRIRDIWCMIFIGGCP